MKNRISIKPFETEQEIVEYVKLYNNMSERSTFDHLEQADVEKLLYLFNKPNPKILNYMIFNEKNQFIGTIGYRKESDFELYLGYRILRNEYRNKGYMSETLNIFVPRLFKDEKVTRLTAEIHSKNKPSIALAYKFGFVHEGTKRKAYNFRGKKVGFEIFSILREEYETKTE